MNKLKLVLSAAVMALTGLVSVSQAAPAPQAAPAKSDSQTGALKVSRLAQNAAEFRAMPSN